jgi:hypothetical protein
MVMNKRYFRRLSTINSTILFCLLFSFANATEKPVKFFSAEDTRFSYTGRVDFSNKTTPRFWAPGAYIKAKFKGSYCAVIVNDQMLYGTYHNYIQVVIDDQKPIRVKVKSKTDTITVASNLADKEHTITIVKDTEGSIGYIEFVGLQCEALLPPPAPKQRRIELFGNSITCGFGNDTTEIPCGKGEWYDKHNAWMSYGAITARALDADYHLSSVSGIGLIHSCCNLPILMPQVFDKIDMRENSIGWNFQSYQPDVVTICLGQNDGIQDSTAFCSAYVDLVKQLRNKYPKSSIVLLNSVMADTNLNTTLKSYITSVIKKTHSSGDLNTSFFFFPDRFVGGCDSHPSVAEHQKMAEQLTAYLRKLKNW